MNSNFAMPSASVSTRPLYPHNSPKTPKRDVNPKWRPEPCPLTREELRRIVAEQLG